MTHRVIISMGSSSRQAVHMQWACQHLAFLLPGIRFSRRIWTRDISGAPRYYINCLAQAGTALSVDELNGLLKQVEQTLHRTRQQVTIDLDLMSYDGERFHLADWSRPYIQKLLPDFQPPQ